MPRASASFSASASYANASARGAAGRDRRRPKKNKLANSSVERPRDAGTRSLGALERLDRYQRSHRWLGLPLGVVYKFLDDRGTLRAATITY